MYKVDEDYFETCFGREVFVLSVTSTRLINNWFECKGIIPVVEYGSFFMFTNIQLYDNIEITTNGGYRMKNKYEVNGSNTIVYTSNGDFFIIDTDKLGDIKGGTWSIDTHGYVRKVVKQKAIKLHILLLGKKRRLCVRSYKRKHERQQNGEFESSK